MNQGKHDSAFVSGISDRFLLEAIPRYRPQITRPWFQLLVGTFVCAILPYLFRHGVHLGPGTASGVNASTAAAVAFVTSYFLHRQLVFFPGVRSGTYTFFAAAVPFASIAIIFLLLRMDYSRFIFITAFLATTTWLIAFKFITRRLEIPNFLVIPGGGAKQLTEIPEIPWNSLPDPPENTKGIMAVVADLRQDLSDDWQRFLTRCTLAGIPVYHYKQLIESLTGRVEINHMSETSYGTLLPNQAYLGFKQVIDWFTALFFLPFFAVIYAIVAPLIVWHSGFPALFVQERVGYRGKRFRMYKFRTMKASPDPSADSVDKAITRDNDQRITPIGKIMRKYRIDELPQILNILQGEMSWIGPRPEAAVLSKWYEEELAFYSYRHVVRPGITGWAQVHQGHVTSTDQVLDKLHFDFFYIKYLSPWLDMLIVLRTIKAVLRGFGAR